MRSHDKTLLSKLWWGKRGGVGVDDEMEGVLGLSVEMRAKGGKVV